MDALESSPCATSRLGDQHSSGGRYFGNYCLIRPIGQGSFATIYLAKHRYLGTTAAIKVLHRHATDVAVRRFLYEARITARLVHPHIIRVLEYDVEQGTPFLVMDYAAYGSMYDYMRQSFPAGTPLTPRQALRYVWPIASALYYMHCCGFIHRDVKPANILLGSGGQVWLSD
ncbi:MAG: serine/threonine protein kinase, partial [Ktedonobacteraceae bacterium]|nr:serine/threonine protein kinase [Ktedonobacteraceae bacterium]